MGLFSNKEKSEEHAPAHDAYKETNSSSSDDGVNSKHASGVDELDRIHTFERVGTHAEYYEKDGLRTEGDGVDHVGAHHKVSFSNDSAGRSGLGNGSATSCSDSDHPTR